MPLTASGDNSLHCLIKSCAFSMIFSPSFIISSKNPKFLSSFSDIFVAVSNNLLVALAPKIFKNLFIPAK